SDPSWLRDLLVGREPCAPPEEERKPMQPCQKSTARLAARCPHRNKPGGSQRVSPESPEGAERGDDSPGPETACRPTRHTSYHGSVQPRGHNHDQPRLPWWFPVPCPARRIEHGPGGGEGPRPRGEGAQQPFPPRPARQSPPVARLQGPQGPRPRLPRDRLSGVESLLARAD